MKIMYTLSEPDIVLAISHWMSKCHNVDQNAILSVRLTESPKLDSKDRNHVGCTISATVELKKT